MTTKKSVALIIVLMMVLSALAGCSSTKTNTPGEATKAPESVEENAETSADKTPDGETSAERARYVLPAEHGCRDHYG